jgi:hypothetical protein
MSEQPTPEAMRQAAKLLGKAAHAGDADRASGIVMIAYDTWPVEDDPVDDMLLVLESRYQWDYSAQAMRWLCHAAQLRLLVEAAYAENADALSIATVVAEWWRNSK